jgi:hypothetical protein
MGMDVIQQHTMFWSDDMPQAQALAEAISARDARYLARSLEANRDLTLAILDYAMRLAHEGHKNSLLKWCLKQDRLLRSQVDGRLQYADAYAARMAWRRGVLRPVIGAGVSQAAGAPGWSTLVDRCLDAAAMLAKPEVSADLRAMQERLRGGLTGPAAASALVEATQTVEDLAGPHFAAFVRGGLIKIFRGPSSFRPPQSDMHCALAELAMPGAHGPGVADVVTYNFDELLEIALIRHYGGAIAVASYGGQWIEALLGFPQTTPIRVWHPHGFVPQFLTAHDGQEDVVFSVRAYEQQYGDESSLASRIVDDSLRHKVCLFIGSSFEDSYQRAQLQRAHKAQPGWYHYAFMKAPSITGWRKDRHEEYFTREAYQAVSSDLLSLGVRPLWIKDYEGLPHAIRWVATAVGLTVDTTNRDFCHGPVERPEVAALYQPMNASTRESA